jgi:DNA-binding LytR/AlgR family response regulator
MYVAICDNEDAAIQHIQGMLEIYREKYSFQTLVFHNAEELIESCLQGQGIDVLFLDIYMGRLSGVDAARKIRQMRLATMIVFTTSDSSRQFEGFEVKAFQYLTKPINMKEFDLTFVRAIKAYKAFNSFYRMKIRGESPREFHTVVVKVSDIIYFASDNKNVIAYTLSQKNTLTNYILSAKLSGIEEDLKNFDTFIRCHQRYLVNVNYVQGITEGGFVLEHIENQKKKIISISPNRWKMAERSYIEFRKRSVYE